MADCPLRPATDRCLGNLLLYQLANRTRAHLWAINLFTSKLAHRGLAEVSFCYLRPKGRFSRVTHPSATILRREPFDLHVLSRPPAFILSQDQTLRVEFVFESRLFHWPRFLEFLITRYSGYMCFPTILFSRSVFCLVLKSFLQPAHLLI